jgi:hypothetical protein
MTDKLNPANVSHHPLPASNKARQDEIPETIERERDQGDDGSSERGQPASKGSGAVSGSGSGAGGGGSPEDYDADAQAGGGTIRHPRRRSSRRHSIE